MDELRKDNVEDIYPLSNLQEGIFFHYRLGVDKKQYFEQTALRVLGSLNLHAFENALKHLIKRHDVLRTVFVHKAPHPPLQIVLRERAFKVAYQDLTESEDPLVVINRYKDSDKNQSFDLTKDILLRAAVFQLPDNEFEIIWSHHHIILDGWCMGILNREFSILYDALVRGDRIELIKPTPFKKYVEWLQKQDSEKTLAHWREYLKGYETAAVVPERNLNATDQGYDGRSYYKYLDEDLVNSLNETCAALKVTVSTLMQTAWGILLGKYNYTEDVVFGAVVSGRPADIPGIDQAVGLFINSVPVRVAYSGDEKISDLLLRIQEHHQQNLNFHYCQLADIQNCTPLKRQLINHLFTFQNYPKTFLKAQSPGNDVGSLLVKNFEIFEQTTYNFNLRIIPDRQFGINVEYNSNAFEDKFIAGLVDQYHLVLIQMVERPSQLLRSIQLIGDTGAGRHCIHGEYCLASDVFSAGIFSNQSMLSDEIAIYTDKESISYRTLAKRVDAYADVVRKFSTNKPVAILLNLSSTSVVVMLACLKTRTPYTFIDPALPEARVKEILKDSAASLFISSTRFLKTVTSVFLTTETARSFFCVDSNKPLYEKGSVGEHVAELWNYVGKTSESSIALGGWVSSYTGELFSETEMDEYSDNALKKLRPYLNPGLRVLEVGCSSGLTMFKIAPHVKEYIGTDISGEILTKTSDDVARRDILNIVLHEMAADNIDLLEGQFDLIILNSVVQNFESLGYFMSVLEKATAKLSATGLLFLGDLQDIDSKDRLINDLNDFKFKNPLYARKVKTDWSNELFISKTFLNDLVHEFPGIKEITHSDKLGAIENELTRFRFDCIIQFDKQRIIPAPRVRQKNWIGSDDVVNNGHHDVLQPNHNPDEVAYIIYTSGSTGRPKGVMVSYKSLNNYISWANKFYFTANDGNMPLLTSLSVDLTITSVLCPISRGKSVYIPENTLDLEAVFSNPLIDTVKITPTHVKLLSSEVIPFTTVRKAIVGGEPLTVEHIEILKALNPAMRIFNEYGPTEATVGCTCAEVQSNPAIVGTPVANTSIFFLDKYHNAIPIGCKGEIAIAGHSLALGYQNDVSLTAARFVYLPSCNNLVYLTGDLARWTPDGTIEYYRRIDTQRKVRGHRIELSDIEKIVNDLPFVKNAVVVLTEGIDNNNCELVCYYLSDVAVDEGDFSSLLLTQLPAHMVPSYFMRIDSLPLTASGKLDYRALPQPKHANDDPTAKLAGPENHVEESLLLIWKDILEIEAIGCDQSFFDVGGHSLKATQMASRIEKDLNVKVSLSTIFDHPTIREIASEIVRMKQEAFQPIERISEQPFYELSHAQRRLWMFEQLDGRKVTNNIPKAFKISGPINILALQKAFEYLIDRHESLRTIFVMVDQLPYQKILKKLEGFAIDIIDLLHDINYSATVAKLLTQNQTERFDLQHGPLLRVKLLRLRGNENLLLFAMHHIISDGWSMEILMRELVALYNGIVDQVSPEIPALSIHYKDYSHWHNKRSDDKKLRNYWMSQFTAPIPKPFIPLDTFKTEVSGFETAFVGGDLTAESYHRILRYCKREQVSLFMVLIAAIDVLLFKFTGQTDIVLGAPNAGRNHPDLEDQVGYYLNIIPLRSTFEEGETFHSLLMRVRKTTIGAYEHQDYSLARILDDLRAQRKFTHPDVFLTGLSVQNYKVKKNNGDFKMSGLTVEPIENYHADTLHSIWFYCMENEDSLNFNIQYDRNALSEKSVQLFYTNWLKILDVVSENDRITVAEIAALLVAPENQFVEKRQLVQDIKDDF